MLVVSGGLTNQPTGEMYHTALAVAVANDKIARRHNALAEHLGITRFGQYTLDLTRTPAPIEYELPILTDGDGEALALIDAT